MHLNKTILVQLVCLLILFLMSGCNAHRPVVPPVEPDWSYHNSDPAESNDLLWITMVQSDHYKNSGSRVLVDE